jgi:hypothetical protein
MSEFELRRGGCVLIVCGEPKPQPVAGPEATSVWNDRDAVSHSLPNWYGLEGDARKDWYTRFTRGFIYLAQTSAKISRCEIDGILFLVDVLKNRNERCIWSGTSSVQLELDWANTIQVPDQWRRRPLQKRRRIGFTWAWAIEAASQIHVGFRSEPAFLFA